MMDALLPIWILGAPVVVLVIDWMVAPGTTRRNEHPLSSARPVSMNLGAPS